MRDDEPAAGGTNYFDPEWGEWVPLGTLGWVPGLDAEEYPDHTDIFNGPTLLRTVHHHGPRWLTRVRVHRAMRRLEQRNASAEGSTPQ